MAEAMLLSTTRRTMAADSSTDTHRGSAILVWIAVSGGIALALVGAVLFVLRRRARAER